MMKRIFVLIAIFFSMQQILFAEETEKITAEQGIVATENKVVVVVQKQPLNENSNQTVTLKKNWLGVYVQVNGKVKIQPLTNTYEVE